MSKKKSKLLRDLEESIRRVKRGQIPKRTSLGDRLRKADGADIPDSLSDPDTLDEDFSSYDPYQE